MRKYRCWFLCCCFLGPAAFADTVWHDVAGLVIDGKGWDQGIGTYRRLPDAAKDNIPDSVWRMSTHSAGLAVVFETDSPSIQFRWTLTGKLAMAHMPATGVSGIDLYHRNDKGNWFFLSNGRPSGKSNASSVHTGNNSSKMREYMAYLPLYNGIESMAIGVAQGKTFSQRPKSNAKPVVYYGTSIAQGGCASRPGMAFTAMLQRRLERNVINLGFSGCGKMEPVMAELLTEIDASVFVIDCLWNVPNKNLVEQRVVTMGQTLRKAYPETPILFVEQSHFKGPFPTEATKEQRKGIAKLKKQGIKNIHVLDGKALLGDDAEGTVDGVHPNDLGMARHAEALLPVLKQLIE